MKRQVRVWWRWWRMRRRRRLVLARLARARALAVLLRLKMETLEAQIDRLDELLGENKHGKDDRKDSFYDY